MYPPYHPGYVFAPQMANGLISSRGAIKYAHSERGKVFLVDDVPGQHVSVLGFIDRGGRYLMKLVICVTEDQRRESEK